MIGSSGAGFGTALIAGLGVTNTAAARGLVDRGHRVVLVDDATNSSGQSLAEELAATFLQAPTVAELAEAIEGVDCLLPAPGLPESHPVFAIASERGVPVISEFDLAAAWDDRPVLAITGTNGKTTVTNMVSEILDASGIANSAVGNLEVPLVAAIGDPAPQAFVVEASSFRLGHSQSFRPKVGTWLNFAPDHLDVHENLDVYESAKASIWANQAQGDFAIFNAEDPVVVGNAPQRGGSGPQVLSFGLGKTGPGGAEPDYFESDGELYGPQGPMLAISDLWSSLPHDRSNALAAAATAIAGGASLDAAASALSEFRGLPHRVEMVAEASGIRWYDDSKATAPHATLAAASGFDRVVLIAGGRNKGLDLSPLGTASSVVAVVGIGESGQEVVDSFASSSASNSGAVPTRVADSMQSAVRIAGEFAGQGDVVLLSPGCASFDWYSSYAERGEDFAAEVAAYLEGLK